MRSVDVSTSSPLGSPLGTITHLEAGKLHQRLNSPSIRLPAPLHLLTALAETRHGEVVDALLGVALEGRQQHTGDVLLLWGLGLARRRLGGRIGGLSLWDGLLRGKELRVDDGGGRGELVEELVELPLGRQKRVWHNVRPNVVALLREGESGRETVWNMF